MMYELFPTPVYVSNIGRKFTDQELNFCLNQTWEKNQNNWISVDDSVLSRYQMESILDFIRDQVFHIAHNIFQYDDNKVKFFITQSWLNKTTKDESHHPHTHSNSIFSGVFYIKTEQSDSIKFFSKHSNQYGHTDLVLPYKENFQPSPYTTHDFNLKVSDGDLVLFDSKLPHTVDPISTEQRISLSFNTFAKGEFGSKYLKTYLPL